MLIRIHAVTGRLGSKLFRPFGELGTFMEMGFSRNREELLDSWTRQKEVNVLSVSQ